MTVQEPAALLAEFIAFDPMHEIDFNGGFSVCHYCGAYEGPVYPDGKTAVFQDATHADECLWRRAHETDVPVTEVWGRKNGAELIARERQRQIEAEGWTPEHDDQHVRHELAWAASCYAAPETVYRVRIDPGRGVSWEEPWPTEIGSARGNPYPFPWRRPECDRLTQLVKAGALIAAEIDRLRRRDQ